MIHPVPGLLSGYGIRLEPLALSHADGLRRAASDGALWELWYTSVPREDGVEGYIRAALGGLERGTMLPWAVREISTGEIVGTTRFHDIIREIDRVEIGYTWYAARWHRTHVNAACKLLLLRHAFEELGCQVVGFRTDGFNLTSQRAIENLGAQKDGTLRHHQARVDGTARDTVMYSIVSREWPDVERHLRERLRRRGISE